MSLPPSYFDALYEQPDPWGFASRWYEQRKYALTLAALPDPTYGAALELGCSIGVLTAQLASRCEALLAVDVSAAALARARERVPASVQLQRRRVPYDWPDGTYDLIVVSEVGYYLDAADLGVLLDRVEQSLRPDGVLVACHWRHAAPDYPLTGDQVHAALAGRAALRRLSRVEEEDFLLEVLSRRPDSVARRTGLLG